MTNGSGSRRGGGKAEKATKLPTAFLGDPLPTDEASMWAALTVAQRAKAVQRMAALVRWIDSDGGIEAKVAAADAGVSVTRMYEMGKAWRERRSLASLGAFAGAPKTRLGRYDTALKQALGPVVDADPNGSVRKLALDLEAASGIPPGEMPSHNTMRRYVEIELRRRQQKTMAGDDVMMDCSACTLTPSDSALLTVFVILDRWTQVVLGAALGDVSDSRSGYALAAKDGMRRIDAGQFADLPWVERMSRAELVVGLDETKWTAVQAEFVAAGLAVPIQPSTKEDRFGRYLRPLTGLRIGTVVLMPTHTALGEDVGALIRRNTATDDQVMRLSVEVDDYNSGLVQRTNASGDTRPPADLPLMLELLSTT